MSEDGEEPTSNDASSAGEEDAGEHDFKCRWSSCGCRFPSLAMLGAHMTRCHAHCGDGGLFYCCWEGCSRGHRAFNARYKMLVHVRTHTNEKPHKCTKCNKMFSRSENLKIHHRSHTGERPYLCPVPGCSKAYSNSSDRFKHVRTHAQDKPYHCKIPGCGKRYTDPSSLRKHVKTTSHQQLWSKERGSSSQQLPISSHQDNTPSIEQAWSSDKSSSQQDWCKQDNMPSFEQPWRKQENSPSFEQLWSSDKTSVQQPWCKQDTTPSFEQPWQLTCGQEENVWSSLSEPEWNQETPLDLTVK